MDKVETIPRISLNDVKEAARKILENSNEDVIVRVNQLPTYVNNLFKDQNPMTLTTIFMLSMHRIGELLLNNIKEKNYYMVISLKYESLSDPISNLNIEINLNKEVELDKSNVIEFASAFSRLTVLFPPKFNYVEHCKEIEFKNENSKTSHKSKIKLIYNELSDISIEVGSLDVYIEKMENAYTIRFKFNIFGDHNLELYNIKKIQYFRELFDGTEIKIEFTTYPKNNNNKIINQI